jgi:hypothetical protein
MTFEEVLDGVSRAAHARHADVYLYCAVYPGGRIMYNTLSTHKHPRRRKKR